MQRLGNQQVRPWIDIDIIYLIKPPHLISFHLANRKSPCARWNRDQATPYFHLSPSLCLSLSHILPASMSAFGLFYGCRFDIPGLKNPGERSISPQAPPSVCCCASDSSDTDTETFTGASDWRRPVPLSCIHTRKGQRKRETLRKIRQQWKRRGTEMGINLLSLVLYLSLLGKNDRPLTPV